MENNEIAFIRRGQLRAWMEERGMNNTDLAARLGTGRAYVSNLFAPAKHFGEKAARSIEKKLFMSAGFLDQRRGKMAPIESWDSPNDLPDGVYALVPRLGIRLSAGQGIEVIDESELPPLAFRESWLKKKHVTSRANLRVLEVDGSSMEPYLQDGDVVLIDLGQKDVIDREVYAIAYGDELRIKRLSKRFDGGLIVQSDNPAFREEVLSQSDLIHVKVLGREIWRGG